MSDQNFKIHPAVFVPVSKCVGCRKILDATTGIESEVPKEGDITVCFYCGQTMVFKADKTLRRASTEELLQFKHDSPESYGMIYRLQQKFRAMKSQREN